MRPIVPFGAGSSLEGHVNALEGGVSIDLSRMNRVLSVNVEDLDVTVEAGVTHRSLNKALANTGVYFWVDPGADATIGGMAATGASGTTTVRYGTMRETVRGLTVVLADGRVIRTGGRARKSSAGYDLTRLFIGSEGTLGVITEITLRVYGLPEAVSAAICAFDSLEGAVQTVITTIQLGIPVARIELLDEVMMDAVNHYSHLSHAVEADAALRVSRHESGRCQRARDVGAGDRRRTWRRRIRVGHDDRGSHKVVACAAQHASSLTRDASRRALVGDRRLRADLEACRVHCRDKARSAGIEGLRAARRPRRRRQLPSELRVQPRRSQRVRRDKALNRRLVQRAIAMGGTCTGEHGIGMGKMADLEEEHGEAVEVMKAIKRALDPDNRMNPGKILRL